MEMAREACEILPAPNKSEFDTKQYRVIHLPNGLKALLIHDDEVRDDDPNGIYDNWPACSLKIGVGSSSDPSDFHGLTHFLEYLITSGDNEFNRFIQVDDEYGYQRLKATTGCNDTTFSFRTKLKCWEVGLQHFARIFKTPFSMGDVIDAVHKIEETEFSLITNCDAVLRDKLLSMLGIPGHPSCIFPHSDLRTLIETVGGDNEVLHRQLEQFRSRHYSAHRMFVCMQSQHSLDDLQELAVKLFSDVFTNQLPALDFSAATHANAFQSKFHEKVIFVKPVWFGAGWLTLPTVTLTWCLPPETLTCRAKPYTYLSFILEYEGEGSISSHLRAKSLAEAVVSGFNTESVYSLLTITVHLTENGCAHLDAVLEAIFSFLRLLKRTGPNQQLFHEIASIQTNRFRCPRRSSTIENVEDLVDNLSYYPTGDRLTGDTHYFDYNAAAIMQAIDSLNERKFNVMVASRQRYDDNVRFELREEQFGTEYTERNMPEKWMSLWNNGHPIDEFTLPAPNPFIANDFTIFYDASRPVARYPTKIFGNDSSELWFRQDDKFLLPHAHCNFYFTTPLALSTPDNIVMNSLYASLLRKVLETPLYPATLDGLKYHIDAAEKGIVLKVSAFNDKLPLVITTIANCMREHLPDCTEADFRCVVQTQLKAFRLNITTKYKKSYLADELRVHVIRPLEITSIEKIRRLTTIEFREVQNFCREYCKQMGIIALMQGNLTEATAHSILHATVSTLRCDAIRDPMSTELCALKLPLGPHYVRVECFEEESRVINFYQIGYASQRTRVLVGLLIESIMSEQIHETVNKKKRFWMSCKLIDESGILAYTIDMQTMESDGCVDDFDKFIEDFRLTLMPFIENLSADEFDEYKLKWMKKQAFEGIDLRDEVDWNWTEIMNGSRAFDRWPKANEILATITQSDVVEFYRDHCGVNERKLSIQTIADPTYFISHLSADDAEYNAISSEKIKKAEEELTHVVFPAPINGVVVDAIVDFKNSLEKYT